VSTLPKLPRRVPGAGLPALPRASRRRLIGRLRVARVRLWSTDEATMTRLLAELRATEADA